MFSLNRLRWGIRGALLTGVAWIVLLWVNLSGLRDQGGGGNAVFVAILFVILVGTLGGLAGLQARQAPSPRYGWLGTAGCLGVFIGTAVLLVGGLLPRYTIASHTIQFLNFNIAGLLLVVGGLLLGAATLRAKVLPRWFGLLLISLPILGLIFLVVRRVVFIPSGGYLTEQQRAINTVAREAPFVSLELGYVLVSLALGYVLLSTAPRALRIAPVPLEAISRLRRKMGFGQKTLWDWMQLLFTASIPVVIAVGGYLFNSSQNERNQEIEESRAEDQALQSYLDAMTDLLANERLRDTPSDSELRSVARARTLAVLNRLGEAEPELERPGILSALFYDKQAVKLEKAQPANRIGNRERKGRILQFLYESDLITRGEPVISLGRANLNDVRLLNARLSNADLSDAHLEGADLGGIHLSNASVSVPTMGVADLSGADLSGAHLSDANLSGTDLSGADLSDANLRGASLRDVIGVGKNRLEGEARSLQGATMPDGSKHD